MQLHEIEVSDSSRVLSGISDSMITSSETLTHKSQVNGGREFH